MLLHVTLTWAAVFSSLSGTLLAESAESQVPQNNELESLMVIARSGINAPRQPMSATPAYNSWMVTGSVASNTLLPIGKRQMYLLGLQMQKDYSQLIGKIKNEKSEIDLNAMSLPSALGSVQAFMLGFLPDTRDAKWDDYNNTIPILFPGEVQKESPFLTALPAGVRPLKLSVTKDGEVDYMYELSSPDVCPGVNSKIVESLIAKWNSAYSFNTSYGEAIQKIDLARDLSYFNASTYLYRSARIFEFIYAQALSGEKPLIDPKSQVYKELQLSYETYTVSTLADRPTLELVMAPLASELVRYFGNQANLTLTKKPRLQSYFGHDKFILGTLMLLNLTNPDCYLRKFSSSDPLNFKEDCGIFPKPSSTVTFEVYRDTNTKSTSVRLLVNGRLVLKIPGLEPDQTTGMVPAEKWIAHLSTVCKAIKNWKEDCGIILQDAPRNNDLLIWLFYFSISTVGLIILLGAVVWSIYWKSKEDDLSFASGTSNAADEEMNLDDSLMHN